MTDVWQRYCRHVYLDRVMRLGLDISRIRFDDAELAGLLPAMDRALANMQALEAGAIANRDEGRMVGHYWLRAPDRSPTVELANEIRSVYAQMVDFVEGVQRGRIRGGRGPFEQFLLLGIGGSALGPQLLAHALGSRSEGLGPHFIDNTDPDGFEQTLEPLRPLLGRTLVLVISKSGGTPETRNAMIEVQHAYEVAGLEFSGHAVAVTQAGSPLSRMAAQAGWLAQFPMWDWVGGRTSVTSVVGLLPAALQGIDVESFLAGAAAMDEATRNPNARRNPAALMALAWRLAASRGKKAMVVLPYKDRLELFARYLQQLVMESLGKEFDRQGIVVHEGLTVYGNKGSTDQHAFVQQLRDGVDDFFVTFIEVLRDSKHRSLEVEPGITAGDYLAGFVHGTRGALTEKGRESILLSIDEVSPATVGQLIALFERAVGLYAELADINAYHQPGVEAGKRGAQAYLDLQRRVVEYLRNLDRPQTAERIAQAIGHPDQAETVLHILEHLGANVGRGILVTEDDDPSKTYYQATQTLQEGAP